MRPYRFKLNTNHDLARGLVFAGFGNLAGGRYYHNSADSQNYAESTQGPWSLQLRRRVSDHIGSGVTTNRRTTIQSVLHDIGAGDFTMACWALRRDNIGSYHGCIANGNYVPALYSRLGTEVGVYWGQSITSGYIMPLNEWHHIACTRIAGQLQFWIDGVYQRTQNKTDPMGNAPITVGTSGNASNESHSGYIADAVVYNRAIAKQGDDRADLFALTDPDNYMLSGLIEKVPETKRFFFKEAPPQPTNLRLLHTPKKKYTTRPYRFKLNDNHPLSEGLVFAGLGNIAGSEQYFDSSVVRSNGKLQGGMTPSGNWQSALGRRVLEFDGLNNRVRIPYKTAHYSTTFSAAIWAKSNTTDHTRDSFVFSMYDFVGANRVWALLTKSELDVWKVNVSDNGQGASEAFFTQSIETTWNHLVMITEDAGDTFDLYYNGKFDSTANPITSPFTNQQSDLFVGGLEGNWAWPGWLSDPMLYSRKLPLSEIQQLADPDNIMLSGLIEPLRDPPSYFFTQPTPTEAITGIFEPLVIGV